MYNDDSEVMWLCEWDYDDDVGYEAEEFEDTQYERGLE
jgi:hypothetical protein